jgi:hypothetical protein
MPQINFTLVKRDKTIVEMLPKEQIKDEFFDLNTQQFMTVSRQKTAEKQAEKQSAKDLYEDIVWYSHGQF